MNLDTKLKEAPEALQKFICDQYEGLNWTGFLNASLRRLQILGYKIDYVEYEIKVRKPRPIKFFGLTDIYNRYSNRQYKWMASLPENGTRIMITWFPDNRGEPNAYIGMDGIVEDMDIIDASFVLKCDNSILICPSGDFNYMILNG